jgi:hypothetical protein
VASATPAPATPRAPAPRAAAVSPVGRAGRAHGSPASSQAAAAATGAVSARSTRAPEPDGRRPARDEGGHLLVAEAPLGPVITVIARSPPRSGRSRQASRRRGRPPAPDPPDQPRSASGTAGATSGTRARPHWRAASLGHPLQARALGGAQLADVAAPRHEGPEPDDPELRAHPHDVGQLVALQQGHGQRQRAGGLARGGRRRVEPQPHPVLVDRSRCPRPRGRRRRRPRRRAGPHPQHARQVVAGRPTTRRSPAAERLEAHPMHAHVRPPAAGAAATSRRRALVDELARPAVRAPRRAHEVVARPQDAGQQQVGPGVTTRRRRAGRRRAARRRGWPPGRRPGPGTGTSPKPPADEARPRAVEARRSPAPPARCRVDVEAPGVGGAELVGGDRQQAGAGADVETRRPASGPGGQGLERQPRRLVVPGAEGHARIEPHHLCPPRSVTVAVGGRDDQAPASTGRATRGRRRRGRRRPRGPSAARAGPVGGSSK